MISNDKLNSFERSKKDRNIQVFNKLKVKNKERNKNICINKIEIKRDINENIQLWDVEGELNDDHNYFKKQKEDESKNFLECDEMFQSILKNLKNSKSRLSKKTCSIDLFRYDYDNKLCKRGEEQTLKDKKKQNCRSHSDLEKKKLSIDSLNQFDNIKKLNNNHSNIVNSELKSKTKIINEEKNKICIKKEFSKSNCDSVTYNLKKNFAFNKDKIEKSFFSLQKCTSLIKKFDFNPFNNAPNNKIGNSVNQIETHNSTLKKLPYNSKQSFNNISTENSSSNSKTIIKSNSSSINTKNKSLNSSQVETFFFFNSDEVLNLSKNDFQNLTYLKSCIENDLVFNSNKKQKERFFSTYINPFYESIFKNKIEEIPYSSCHNIWSLSNIYKWFVNLYMLNVDFKFTKNFFTTKLIDLIKYHKKNLSLETILKNVEQIEKTFLNSRAIEFKLTNLISKSDEDSIHHEFNNHTDFLIINKDVNVNGVLVDLLDCYLNNHLNFDLNYNCIYTCNVPCFLNDKKKIDVSNINNLIWGDDWASHWKINSNELKILDKVTLKKQSLIYDLRKYEYTFIERGKCFTELLGPLLIRSKKILIHYTDIISVNNFEEDVLFTTKELVDIHERYIYKPLLKIFFLEGQFINNVLEIANIYYFWTLKVRNALFKYICVLPMIEDLLSNLEVKKWVEINAENIKEIKRLKINASILFLSTFNSRYQQLPLQLFDIRKLFKKTDKEYIKLTKTIDSLKNLGNNVNKMKRQADNNYNVKKLLNQLEWKNIHIPENILDFKSKNFVYRDDVYRKSDLKFKFFINHLVLLGNFFFITEKVISKTKHESYKITEDPIPLEFLLFEENPHNDENNDSKVFFTNRNNVQNLKSYVTDLQGNSNESSFFSFKIKHAGKPIHYSFTFFTKTQKQKNYWIKLLTETKSNFYKELNKIQRYKITEVNSTVFAYEQNFIYSVPICVPHDLIYEVSEISTKKLEALGHGSNIYNDLYNYKQNIQMNFSRVQCSFEFTYLDKFFFLIGTYNGIFCCDMNNNWKRVLEYTNVTKIHVETSINLILFLSNNIFLYCSLHKLIKLYYGKGNQISCFSLSKTPVTFFTLCKHKNINMIFYAKKKNSYPCITNFTILVPEFDNNKNFSIFKTAKHLNIPMELYDISVFSNSFLIHTKKCFEFLTINCSIPKPIPILNNFDTKKTDNLVKKNSFDVSYNKYNIEKIKKLISSNNTKPLKAFKLENNLEILLAFNNFSLFVNKKGFLSRDDVLNFDFTAKSVSFKNNNLIVCSEQMIKIWLISIEKNQSNNLIQIITGKNILMLNENDLCFSMANPKVLGLQIIYKLELKNN